MAQHEGAWRRSRWLVVEDAVQYRLYRLFVGKKNCTVQSMAELIDSGIIMEDDMADFQGR